LVYRNSTGTQHHGKPPRTMRTIKKAQDVIYPATEVVVKQSGYIEITTIVHDEVTNYLTHTFSLEEFEEIAKGVLEDLEKKRATKKRLDKLKIETDADYKVFNRAFYEEMDKKVNIVGRPFIPYEQMITRGNDKGWFLRYHKDTNYIAVETSFSIQHWYLPSCTISSVRKSGKTFNAPCREGSKTFDELR
jgi:hypothetical protein